MGEQPSPKPPTWQPGQTGKTELPGAQRGKRDLSLAAPWLIFLFALAVCSVLGLFISLFRSVAPTLMGERAIAIQEEPVITIKTAYMPLGCIFTAVIGWLLISQLKLRVRNRLWYALYWAVFAVMGYLIAELVCLGGVDEFTAIRLLFWGSLGAALGILSPQPRPTGAPR